MSDKTSQHTFIGFSTVGTDLNKNWTLYDIDLIKQDLYNHFYTRVGERRMLPNYGCKIWDYLMEPSSKAMRDLIAQEATRICHSDTRVSVQKVDVYAIGNGVRVEITLHYIPLDTVGEFVIEFNQRAEY